MPVFRIDNNLDTSFFSTFADPIEIIVQLSKGFDVIFSQIAPDGTNRSIENVKVARVRATGKRDGGCGP